jgi:precorrin-8X/cobalt-precorrin-8 methylmutase
MSHACIRSSAVSPIADQLNRPASEHLVWFDVGEVLARDIHEHKRVKIGVRLLRDAPCFLGLGCREAMSLFDFYIMVDWSGGARRRGGRSDTIWIAHGSRIADEPLTESPFSRTEAVRLIHSLLVNEVESKRRVLVSFDFAYGYPIDFAAALQAATGKSDRVLPWLMVWQYLNEQIKDDEGTAQGTKPNNRSNRFEVANKINALLSPDPKVAGPFWCASPEAAYSYIPQRRPPEPFQTAQGYVIKGLRLADKRARSGSPFRLFGTASVGSQSLTGIARLHELRNNAKLDAVSAVWPFETGWATKAKWLPKHVSILHAEIYPSVRDPLPDEIKDRGQVRAMWQWARDLDRENLLWREFCRPIEVEPGSKEDMAIQLTEGWILGSSITVINQ